MRKQIILLFLAMGLASISFGQNKNQIKRANDVTSLIAKELNLSEDDQKKVNEIYLAQIVANVEQIKGKDLTNKQKQAIYKKGNANRLSVLTEVFGQEKAMAISKAGFEAMKALKNK